ncbi:MAG: endonuclease/exonuclease/phosphatase family protein [Chloroflexota bacterium]
MSVSLRDRVTWFVNAYNLFLGCYLLLRIVGVSTNGWLGLLHTFALWLFVPLLLILPGMALCQAKRTVVIACVLLVVGFYLLAPKPSLHQSDAPHDVRLLTYNLRDRNPTINESIDWVLEQDADVIILQELMGTHQRELPRLAAQYPYEASIPNNIYLFSRFPLIESELVVLEERTENSGRVALRTVLEIEGTPVAIYGVHLTSPIAQRHVGRTVTGRRSLDSLLNYNEARRNGQIETLVQLATDEDMPVILAGDFNLSHTSLAINTLHDAGLQDSYRLVGRDWGMTWSYPSLRLPILRIDYVWSSAPITPLRMYRGDFSGSDHLPVVVDLQIGSEDTVLTKRR